MTSTSVRDSSSIGVDGFLSAVSPAARFAFAADITSRPNIWPQISHEIQNLRNRLIDREVWARDAVRDLDYERLEGDNPIRRAAAESIVVEAVGAYFEAQRAYDDALHGHFGGGAQ